MTANRNNVIQIAASLKDLKDEMVFIGGSIVELLLDPDYNLPNRASKDVDTVVEICSYSEYVKLEKKLRALGFKNDKDIICRWEILGVLVDIMPTDEKILGFSNRWYKDLLKHAGHYQLTEALNIRLVTAPYLLATKLEAFGDRGGKDYLGSHDLDDIVTLLDGRETLLNEICNAEVELQAYLKESFEEYLQQPRFMASLEGHLAPYGAGIEVRKIRIQSIINEVLKKSPDDGEFSSRD